MIRFNRREFLKKTAVTTVAATGLCQLHAPSLQAYTLKSKPKVVKKIATTCEMCKAHCPMVVRLYKDHSLRLSGNVHNPVHGSLLCSRGLAAAEMLSHPDRLKYPMKRVGERGLGRWQRISWDEALMEIGTRIRKAYAKQGGDGLALFTGGRSSGYIKEFFTGLNCDSIHDSSFDRSTFIRSLGYGTTFGTVPDPDLTQFDTSQCIVLFGSHIGENVLVSQVRQFAKVLGRDDVEIVVVDPRFSSAAAKSHHYLPIKPGTDTALILGWIHYLISNGLYDQRFVEESCVGFAELRDHVSPYTLQETARITDLPESHIAGIAEILGQAGSAVTLVPGNHLSWYGNDVSRVRGMAILSALLGVVPQDAGAVFDFAATSKPVDVTKVLGNIRSGRTDIVGIWGQNVVQSESPGYFVSKAFREAEFIFCTDIFPSETSLYADIILPEASFLERADFCQTWVTGERKVIAASFQVVEPLFESRSPFAIVKGIAEASGLGDRFKGDSDTRRHEEAAVMHNTTLAGLRHAGGIVVQRILRDDSGVNLNGENSEWTEEDPFFAPAQIFKTPSGKVELSSSWLSHNGFNNLPVYTPPMEVPEGFLRLLSGRCPVHSLSRTSGLAWLNHEISENILWISEASAARLSIKDGQQVRLENNDGVRSVNLIRVKVTPGIRDDCCYASHGFGNRSPLMGEGYNRGVSVNHLLSRSSQDMVTGVRGLRDIFVRLSKG